MIVPVNVTFDAPGDPSPWRALASTSALGLQVTVWGTGPLTAAITFEVSNDFFATEGITLATVTVAGTDMAMEAGQAIGTWAFARARCTGITGTDAQVKATLVTG